ncbi:MAG: SpoIIE family protein phosphatase [Spirochaetes bacterium]|nr:SpoIIE family protein phosphatase [Spirochaetota bacterium]
MKLNAVKKIKFDAKPENLQQAREFITKFGGRMGLNARQINHLKLSIDEACSNVIRHAYTGLDRKDKSIEVQLINRPEFVETFVIDWGKESGIDIEKLTSPDLDKYVSLKKKGGLGLFMIKKFMDEVEQKRENNINYLIMRQKVERPEGYLSLLKKNIKWENMSLKIKFSLISTTAISVLLFSIFLVSLSYQKRSLYTHYIYNAEKTIKKISANAAPYILDNQDLALTMIVKEVQKKDETVLFAGIIDAYNYIVAHTDVSLIYKKFTPPEVRNKESKNGITLGDIKQGKVNVLYMTSPIMIKNTRIGQAFVGISKAFLQNELSKFQSNLKLTLFTIFFWALGIVGVYLFGFTFINPLKQLSDEIKRVGKDGMAGRLYFRGKGEFAEVAQAFNKMMSELKQAEVELTDTTRLKKEMQLAQSIQHTLLPKSIPRIEGYDIGAKYEAAMEVGGDYYDFFDVDKNSLGIAVGDVSGKGIGGALVMTMTRTALRLEARGDKRAAHVLANLNNTLDGEFKKGMYITLFYVVLDSKKRVINYASAGHNPMILYRGDTGQLYNLNPKGFSIGLNLGGTDLFRQKITQESIKLKKGDLLLIYTDGITEAMNSAREEFGEHRLFDTLKKYNTLPAEEMAEKILDEITDFTAGYPQSDDITFVIVKEKTNVTEIEYTKRLKLFELIESGLAVKQACKKVGFTSAKYYRLKAIKDKHGMKALKEDIDTSKREIQRLDIEGSKKLLNIVARHPEYSVSKLQKELNTEEYGFYKIETKLITRELKRLNLTTTDKRKRYAKRESMMSERGKKSIFARSGISKSKVAVSPKEEIIEKKDKETKGLLFEDYAKSKGVTVQPQKESFMEKPKFKPQDVRTPSKDEIDQIKSALMRGEMPNVGEMVKEAKVDKESKKESGKIKEKGTSGEDSMDDINFDVLADEMVKMLGGTEVPDEDMSKDNFKTPGEKDKMVQSDITQDKKEKKIKVRSALFKIKEFFKKKTEPEAALKDTFSTDTLKKPVVEKKARLKEKIKEQAVSGEKKKDISELKKEIRLKEKIDIIKKTGIKVKTEHIKLPKGLEDKKVSVKSKKEKAEKPVRKISHLKGFDLDADDLALLDRIPSDESERVKKPVIKKEASKPDKLKEKATKRIKPTEGITLNKDDLALLDEIKSDEPIGSKKTTIKKKLPKPSELSKDKAPGKIKPPMDTITLNKEDLSLLDDL